MDCEVCGKPSERLSPVLIDETEFNTCRDCSVFGKKAAASVKAILPAESSKGSFGSKKAKHSFSPGGFDDFEPVDNYNIEIGRARQKLGLTFRELSEKVFEKESTLRKIESGKLQLSKKLALKLEEVLKIKLIQ